MPNPIIFSNQFYERLKSMLDDNGDREANADLVLLLMTHLIKTKYDKLKMFSRLGATITPQLVIKIVLAEESDRELSELVEGNLGIIESWNLEDKSYSDNYLDPEDFNDPFDSEG